MPLFKVAILPVSSGASFTGLIDKDWVAFILPPFESDTKKVKETSPLKSWEVLSVQVPSLLLINWPFVVSRLVIDKVSPSISLKPVNKSEVLMIYEVSSMPLFKVAILPVSSGASFIDLTVMDACVETSS